MSTNCNTILVDESAGIHVTGGNSVSVNGILWHDTPITVTQATTATTSVQNQYIGNPEFAADGYHIRANSAALDVGLIGYTSTDFDANARPYSGIPDLGADELLGVVVQPDAASTLIFTDTDGSETAVSIPSGAITETFELIYTPVPTASLPGFAFAGHAFELDAYQNDLLVTDYHFKNQIIVSLRYSDADLAGMNENKLSLLFWNEYSNDWEDAACGPYQRVPEENRLSVPICHLTQFGLFGQYTIYLPHVTKN